MHAILLESTVTWVICVADISGYGFSTHVKNIVIIDNSCKFHNIIVINITYSEFYNKKVSFLVTIFLEKKHF